MRISGVVLSILLRKMTSNSIRQSDQLSRSVLPRLFNTFTPQFSAFRKWYQSFWTPRIIEPPYSHVTQVGDPILRQNASPVPDDSIKSEQVKFLVDQMVEVLRNYDLVGVAAPQVGIALRIIVMEFSEKKKERFTPAVYEARKMSTLPLTVIINPQMKVTDFKKNKFPEGCASIKGYAAEVERYEAVELSGFSRTGENVTLKLKGWNARIAQHEMDHLDGRVYTDVMDRSTFNCTCWEAVNALGGRIEIRFTPK